MLEKLGCNFKIETNDFKSWFKHPASDTDVNVFLDPSHMLKLVRNALDIKNNLLIIMETK